MADFQGYIVLFLVWLVSTLSVRAIFGKKRAKAPLPPSPPALPILGHLHLINKAPHKALMKLSKRYGPLMHIKLGSYPCLVSTSPETARFLLQTQEISFADRPPSAAISFLAYGAADFIFASYGPTWRHMKKIIVTELLGGKMVDQFYPIRHEEVKQLLQSVYAKAKAGESMDMAGVLMRLTNNVISGMTISQRCSGSDDAANAMRMILQETATLLGMSSISDYIWFCKNLDLHGYWKKLANLRERLYGLMENLVTEREAARRKNKEMGVNEGPGDMLDMVLDVAEDPNSEVKFSRANIKAFIVDIFFSGTKSASITIEWALAELINNPRVMKKAREEIDSVVGNKRVVEESDLQNLPYIRAIVKEVLRLHPTIPLLVRSSTQDCIVTGYEIPAKTRILINAWAIARDPKYWENPLEFCPERFIIDGLSEKNQLDVRGLHFSVLPFGSGRRGCPGTSLALQVMQTSVAGLIQCFDFKVGAKGDGTTVNMEEGGDLTLSRSHPLVLVPVPRLNPFPSI